MASSRTIPVPGQAAEVVLKTGHGHAGSLGLGLPQSRSAGHVPTGAPGKHCHAQYEQTGYGVHPKTWDQVQEATLLLEDENGLSHCEVLATLPGTSSIEECVVQLRIFFPECSWVLSFSFTPLCLLFSYG